MGTPAEGAPSQPLPEFLPRRVSSDPPSFWAVLSAHLHQRAEARRQGQAARSRPGAVPVRGRHSFVSRMAWVFIDALKGTSRNRPPSVRSTRRGRGMTRAPAPCGHGGCDREGVGASLFTSLPSFCFVLFCLPTSNNVEEDVALKTNKHIYSQLLRATANKNTSLPERIDVLVHLLDQLARGSAVQ